ncbi:uncharacterized protein LOC133910305, partial [Phragmites australis]|uniref:uncharacterized protein LOC133910305 n=1 Tax=Phragmites australis TaxID=29695 RepID=UPI002D76BA8C
SVVGVTIIAGDQQPPVQRYWFPYWTSPPQPPHPPAHRPAPRLQLSRQDSHLAWPQSPQVVSSPSRRPPQPTSTTTVSSGAGAASPQAQPQPTRLFSRPSPSRAPPLSSIREPNAPPYQAHEGRQGVGQEEGFETRQQRARLPSCTRSSRAGVADMVQKISATTPSSSGHKLAAVAAGPTVITLTGENKGASMKIDSVANGKNVAGKERRGHRLDAAEREEAAGAKGLTSFINSNVQVTNNSLLLQSSCSGGNPGVHLKLTTKSKKKDAGGEPGGKGKK